MKENPRGKYPQKELTEKIINAAYAVHNRLGSSSKEQTYRQALIKELEQQQIAAELQTPMSGGPSYLLADKTIVVEVTAQSELKKSKGGKFLHDLKTSGHEVGMMVNFGKKVQVKRKIISSFASAKMRSGAYVGKEYVEYSRRRLLKEFYPKIAECVNQLTEEDVWWRAHETDNSIGNLVLHLNGNVRQWIITGIGGIPFERNRPQEFAERTHIPKNELLTMFEQTLTEADMVLERFDPKKILEVRHFQKWEVTCLEAISHVVEHFAEHTGQIIYITKLRKGMDLKFFKL